MCTVPPESNGGQLVIITFFLECIKLIQKPRRYNSIT
jgi:hypothetical protein